jgi:hypothetical protein
MQEFTLAGIHPLSPDDACAKPGNCLRFNNPSAIWAGKQLVEECVMPEKKTVSRAKRAKKEGKAASTQAGEFVHEEIEHVREGKHGARSAKQAIAIGLSKARRAGVKVGAPKKASAATKRKAEQDSKAGSHKEEPSPTRSRATKKALKKEGSRSVSKKALSSQARKAASKRSATDRSAAAKKAARTKGAAGRSKAAKKAAATRARS